MRGKKSRLQQVVNLRRLIDEHLTRCESEDCGVSLIPLEILARELEEELTPEEVKVMGRLER